MIEEKNTKILTLSLELYNKLLEGEKAENISLNLPTIIRLKGLLTNSDPKVIKVKQYL